MIKYLLTLFASSASVVVLLMATNLIFISSSQFDHFVSNKSVSEFSLANLNIASATLGLNTCNQPVLDAHFGCSCSLCIQSSQI